MTIDWVHFTPLSSLAGGIAGSLACRRARSWRRCFMGTGFATVFVVRHVLDRRLLAGSLMFGVGWGAARAASVPRAASLRAPERAGYCWRKCVGGSPIAALNIAVNALSLA
jgi:hypothetical protein